MTERGFFGIALVVTVVIAGRFVTAPLESLLLVVPDDAFYYLQIARQIADTGISTADGLSPTNGYHPLWMLILTILAAVLDDNHALLRAAITVSFAAHVGVALMLRAVIGRLVGAPWGWTAASLWLINPLAIVLAMQTVESMLYAMALLAALASYFAMSRAVDDGRPGTGVSAGFGAVLGLLCLTRTEGVVIAGLALAWVGFRLLRRHGAGTAIAHSTVAGSALLVVVAPWLLFSWWQTGTIVQDSGAMKTLWTSSLVEQGLSRVLNLVVTATFLLGESLRRMLSLPNASISLVVLLFLAMQMTMVAVFALRRQGSGPAAHALQGIAASVAAVTLVAGLTLTDRQVWWLTLPALSAVVVVVIIFALAERRIRAAGGSGKAGAWCRAALMAAALLMVLPSLRQAPVLYPWQPDVLASQRAIEARLGPGPRIGSFNAGIPMYLGSGQAVSLDGLVSHDARLAWARGEFDAYVRANGITYIADEVDALDRARRFMTVPLALVEIERFPLEGWHSPARMLWRVER